MYTIDLNGKWKMRDTRHKNWISAIVPGTVFTDLINAKVMKDPLFRDASDEALAYSDSHYEYTRQFEWAENVRDFDQIRLRCEGLDTVSEIRLNGEKVAETDNMHRTYEFNVRHLLQKGMNTITIIFYSPVEKINKRNKEYPIYSLAEAIGIHGFPHLRKAHSMFGWDWGPKVPDAGIWRNINIQCYRVAALDDIYVSQEHRTDSVKVDAQVSVDIWDESFDHLEVSWEIEGPDHSQICRGSSPVIFQNKRECKLSTEIKNPELWWPNGYGSQSLYHLKFYLSRGEEVLDKKEMKIGLRELHVLQEDDEWGESFAFQVNGVAIFAQGADYILEDNLMSKYSKERTEQLIKDCVESHFNCIRVWGGGIYPDNYFYDLCDQYGLIVWQDFMFASIEYPSENETFIRNVEKELADNIKRLRHHACIGLWSGNNEAEWVMLILEQSDVFGLSIDKEQFPIEKMKKKYTEFFEEYIPEVVKKYDPNRFYWPSSPSSGGGFDNPNDENRGDVHFWDVWHRMKPFEEYRDYVFRFCSEFGFQAFPNIKTVNAFTLPEDRNVFSSVMENHQKGEDGNKKIVTYMADYYKYPENLDGFIYTSQLLQGEAIKYGVEHWRRNRGRSMGAIYWQLNDCWPCISWSSIDYYGRWKALHYFAKRFYAPVLISAADVGTDVTLYLTNDQLEPVKGMIEWKLRDSGNNIVNSGQHHCEVQSLSAKACTTIQMEKYMTDGNSHRLYLQFSVQAEGKCLAENTLLFVRPKYFDFKDPQIVGEVKEDDESFVITLRSVAFAKAVELDLTEADAHFSDNFFDLSAGDKKCVYLYKDNISEPLHVSEIKEQLTVRSLFDTIEYVGNDMQRNSLIRK
ncbi:beta-mannosidase [Salipaludibacillus sp. HK11]|uniref:beta-mannosidase n=1 Tax=Salipaludibacillus sp. HK11 TaxID=3394320 RepID=UPI0039FDCD41